ncbi:MAG: GntR family transcriptional regulator [Verrucomicrobia bacterium]|nr:GntR family transcriptional regulator [Verrucomicrobiota bacterium]
MKKRATRTEADPVFRLDLVRRLLREMFEGRWAGGDRLVELRPNCGAVMRPFGPRQIEDIYDVRGLLEGEATRLACNRVDAREVKHLTSTFKQLLAERKRDDDWSRRAWAVDRAMHELLATACGNRRLAEEIARYGRFAQVIREVVGNRSHAQEDAIRAHLEILKALASKRPNASADAMRKHIRQAAQSALDVLAPKFGTASQPT